MADSVQRILQYTYGGDHVSGIDTYLLETYRAMDKNRLQFDFLFRYEVPYTQDVRAELEALGASIHSLDVPEGSNPIRRQLLEISRLWQFFRENRYAVVEVNMTALFMCLSFLTIAWMRGARARVLHAHDSVPNEAFRKRVLKRAFAPALDKIATHHWACSPQAASYLFPRSRIQRGEWTFIKNSIDADRFQFDSQARSERRDELGVGDDLCVGMVGRFTEQKNYPFAIDVLNYALKQRDDVILVLVGSGPLTSAVESLASSLNLESRIRMTGARSDIPQLMSAFDVLLAPSEHEGFPVVGLEAQATGLPLVVSAAFPAEADIAGGMRRLELDRGAREWAREVIAAAETGRVGGVDDVKRAGYDRLTATRELEDCYRGVIGSVR